MIKQLALLVAIIVLGSSAGDAAAKSRPFKVSDYPIEVRKTLSLGPVTCREVAGGGKVGFSRNTVRRVDFNGDGIKDYIVSFENTTCGGREDRWLLRHRRLHGGFSGDVAEWQNP